MVKFGVAAGHFLERGVVAALSICYSISRGSKRSYRENAGMIQCACVLSTQAGGV